MTRLGYYEIHFTAGDVNRATVFETKEELMQTVEMLYQFMHREDTIEIKQTLWITDLLGKESRMLVTIFKGSEKEVRELLKV